VNTLAGQIEAVVLIEIHHQAMVVVGVLEALLTADQVMATIHTIDLHLPQAGVQVQ
jgi:hypothetical protein